MLCAVVLATKCDITATRITKPREGSQILGAVEGMGKERRALCLRNFANDNEWW